jgi:hypothetical protein
MTVCRPWDAPWRADGQARRLRAGGRAARDRDGSDTKLRPSFLRTTPARKPRTECCCQPVAAMMAAIVVPARSCSIATICALLLPARVLASAPEAVSTGTGRFDDLRLAVFTGRKWVAVLSLDFVLVMGPSQGLRDAVCRTTLAPPRQITRRGSAQKPRLSGSQFSQQCSVCREMPVHFEQDDALLPANWPENAGHRTYNLTIAVPIAEHVKLLSRIRIPLAPPGSLGIPRECAGTAYFCESTAGYWEV